MPATITLTLGFKEQVIPRLNYGRPSLPSHDTTELQIFHDGCESLRQAN